jgi:hypothetical protein
MKKHYLTILGLACTTLLFGQTNADLSNVAVEASPKMTTSVYEQTSASTSTTASTNSNNIRRSNAAVVVGNTKYDLQTNAAVARRVILHSNGTVSMVWTQAADDGFQERGAGYYYVSQPGGWFNPGPLNNVRLESIRTGWPQIGVMTNGNEFTLGHLASDGGWARAENTGLGTTFAQTDASVNDDGLWKPIWGRMSNTGDTVHLVSSYTDSSAVGELRAKTINGVYAAMTYSRSLDGGKTWPISHITLPGYDSTRYNSGGGDQYSIDARGNVVAIVTTDILEDLAYWKSTDYGLTFTKVIIDSFKYAPYTSKTLMLDTPFTQDGTSTVVVDKGGNVHVAWGISRAFDDDTTNETYSFYPGTAGIGYWNEIDQNIEVIAVGSDLDLNNDGILTFAQGNIANLSGGNLPTGVNHVARTGNTSIMTMPSMGMDKNGRIFVSFSCVNEQAIDQIWSLNLRDAYIVMSQDTGKTWADPLNVTNLQEKEVAFPSIARDVDDYIHMQFQSDDIPGTNLQNNVDAIGNHPVVENDICYIAVPVSQVIAASLDDVALSVDKITSSKVFVVGQNQPNPFIGSTDVTIYLSNPSNLNVTITNIAGKVVSSFKTDELATGNHIVTIDGSKLKSGIYFYTMSASNGETVTKKMVVK